jgi:hypothetical protein
MMALGRTVSIWRRSQGSQARTQSSGDGVSALRPSLSMLDLHFTTFVM